MLMRVWSCTALTSVKLPLNLKIIEGSAFQSCSRLQQTELPPNLEEVYGGAFAGCVFPEINIPESLTKIDGWDLICTDMTEITLPKGMRTVMNQAFWGFKSLKNIYVEPGNKYLKSVDGVLYSANNNYIYVYPQARTEESYEIPDGTRAIEAGAFRYTKNLKHISVPDSVVNIYYDTFSDSGITSVEIPDKVTDIGSRDFFRMQ